VFGPVGPDGYSAQIWDPMTGVMPQMLQRLLKTAPAGADMSWNYQH
jgi:hypothetical protein